MFYWGVNVKKIGKDYKCLNIDWIVRHYILVTNFFSSINRYYMYKKRTSLVLLSDVIGCYAWSTCHLWQIIITKKIIIILTTKVKIYWWYLFKGNNFGWLFSSWDYQVFPKPKCKAVTITINIAGEEATVTAGVYQCSLEFKAPLS